MLTEKQIAARTKCITGSDAAAILGTHRYADMYDIWAVKTGRKPDTVEPNTMMELGHAGEPLAVEKYEKETGRKCRKVNRTIYMKQYSFIGGHPDRIVAGDYNRGVECKCVFMRSEKDWDNGVPDYYLPQTMHYALVTGRMKWDYSVLFMAHGRHEIFEVEFTKDQLFDLLQREIAFWQLVQDDIEPDVSHLSTSTLKHLWPSSVPEKVQVADDTLHGYVKDRARNKEMLDVYKAQLELCDNKIRQRIKDAETLVSPSGETLLTYKETKTGSRRFNFKLENVA